MVALWDDIRIRHGDVPGAARPMPLTSATAHTNTLPNAEGSPPRIPKWAYDLCGDGGGRGEPGRVPSQTVSLNTESAAPAENSLLAAPVYVSNVWTRLNGKPLDDGETPHYNRVFQGF